MFSVVVLGLCHSGTKERLLIGSLSTTSPSGQRPSDGKESQPLSSSPATHPPWWSTIQFVSWPQPSLVPQAHSSQWTRLTPWPCPSWYDARGSLGIILPQVLLAAHLPSCTNSAAKEVAHQQSVHYTHDKLFTIEKKSYKSINQYITIL